MRIPFFHACSNRARAVFRVGLCCGLSALPLPVSAQLLRVGTLHGIPGGQLHLSLSSEPRTLNPLLATDIASRTVTSMLNADLLHIDRATDTVRPALASSWRVSPDGCSYLLHLRKDVRFSDGSPLTAADVVFSFGAYLDPKLGAPQRDLLLIGGKPIRVTQLGPYLVRFDLPHPYAAAARLFDGIAILPRHLLQPLLQSGRLAGAWNLATSPAEVAGLGPFRLRSYRPGVSLTLERNPYYWKQDAQGHPLPYLDAVDLSFTASQDQQTLRFAAGQLDMVARLSADSYSALSRVSTAAAVHRIDGGPGLEYDLLLFNLNADVAAKAPQAAQAQRWFEQEKFRKALSLAVDRSAIVHLVYEDRAVPLATPVTPASHDWAEPGLKPDGIDPGGARALLRDAGFTWRDGKLMDQRGEPVRFTILANAGNRAQSDEATLIAHNFTALGIDAQAIPLEFLSFLQRITRRHDFDAAVIALSAGDTDPNGNISLWLSDGNLHLWDQNETKPATPWEAEIDALMQHQMSATDSAERHKLYYRVQSIYTSELPFLSLVSPDMLGAVRAGLIGPLPSPLDPEMLDEVATFYFQR